MKSRIPRMVQNGLWSLLLPKTTAFPAFIPLASHWRHDFAGGPYHDSRTTANMTPAGQETAPPVQSGARFR